MKNLSLVAKIFLAISTFLIVGSLFSVNWLAMAITAIWFLVATIVLNTQQECKKL